MNFTGKNLDLLVVALEDAIDHINTEIGLHPEPKTIMGKEDIKELKKQRKKYEKLYNRVYTKRLQSDARRS